MRPYTQNRGCGNAGGDKPRPYGKTGSVGVGAAIGRSQRLPCEGELSAEG